MKKLCSKFLIVFLCFSFTINSYNIQKANSAVGAVTASVIATNPEILVPVVGVALVGGGLYLGKKVYDDTFKPWVMSKISSLTTKTMYDYFNVKTDGTDYYATATSKGADWIVNIAKDFTNENINIPSKSFTSTTLNNYTNFVDEEGYYTVPYMFSFSGYYDFKKFSTVIVDWVFVSAGSTFSVKIYNNYNDNKYVKSFTNYCDGYYRIEKRSYGNNVYETVPYITFSTNKETPYDYYSGKQSIYDYKSVSYNAYYVDSPEVVTVPSSTVVGNSVLDWDAIRSKSTDVGVKINPEPEQDESGKKKYFPVIPWVSETELGDGIRTDTDDFTTIEPTFNPDGSISPDGSTNPDSSTNPDGSGSSNPNLDLTVPSNDIPKLDFSPLMVATRKFPFCIPWDLYDCVKIFDSEESARSMYSFKYKFEEVKFSDTDIIIIPEFELDFAEIPYIDVLSKVFKYFLYLMFLVFLINKIRGLMRA